MIIKNAKVYSDGCRFVEKDLIIRDGRIVFGAAPQEGEDVIDAGGAYALPGLVDIHFHGAVGHDFCDADEAGLQAIADFEASKGVLAICPATMTFSEETRNGIMDVAAAHKHERGAALVGHERLLAEIDGAAGDHVGDAGDKFRGGGEKSGVVEGIVFAWNVVEDEIHAEHRAGFDKVAQADVPPVAQIVHIHPVGPALLAGHEGNTVARAGGDADDIIRRQPPFHQGVEHADRVQAPHAAALEHQSEFHPISLS